MPDRLHLLENFLHDSPFIYDECRTHDSLVRHPVHGLLTVNAISVGYPVAFVGQERERQLELLLELLVRGD